MKRALALALLAIAPLAACAATGVMSWAEDKKDISDPVLKEIISSFYPRMTRFIDTHGANVFVADEPITRGKLLLALYEYDKSLKINKKDFVTKQELDEVRNKLSLIERGGGGGAVASSRVDVTQIINDLQPNMPILLDNSLNDSKVFNSLRNEIWTKKQDMPDTIVSDLAITKNELSLLEKRLQKVEGSRVSAGGTTSAYVTDAETKEELGEIRERLAYIENKSDDDMKKKVVQTQNELSVVEKRLQKMERSVASIDREAGTSALSAPDAVTKQELGEIRERLAYIENKSDDDVKKTTVQTQNELFALEKRLQKMERSITSINRDGGMTTAYAAPDTGTKQELGEIRERLAHLESKSDDDIKKSMAQNQKELARLKKRIDDVERPASVESGSSSELRQYTSLLTKVSFGLSMIAAFFIAR
jgi:predicted  nucleic acid-binding Zn-ribbon protein